jgi:acyl-CoA thioesterase
VKAVQQGRTIFTLMVSFSKVEVNNLVAQWPMPKVKSPEDSMKQEDLLQHLADIELNPKRKEYLLQHAQVGTG